MSVISRGGSLGLVGEEQVKSNPVTSPATELQWDLGQGYLGPQWAQVGGKKNPKCHIYARWHLFAGSRDLGRGVHSKRFMLGSPQNAVECLQMKLLGRRWGEILGLLQLQRRTPCPSLKTCLQQAPRK